jgi:hypothetical protein
MGRMTTSLGHVASIYSLVEGGDGRVPGTLLKFKGRMIGLYLYA